MDYTRMEEDLIRDEGVRLRVYICSAGHPTIGVGHKLTPREASQGLSEVSLEQAGYLLHMDIGIAMNGCAAIFGRDRFDSLSESRCQTASKNDPASASNSDPLRACL